MLRVLPLSLYRTVIELVKKDPSIVNDEDEASNTPLHLAATEGHVKCCKELLERGAEVDARWDEVMSDFVLLNVVKQQL